jgi:hypothetical protein
MSDNEEHEEAPLVDNAQRNRKTIFGRFMEKVKEKVYFFLFEYHTSQEIRIMDRRLGYIYYFCLIAIMLYLILFVFMFKKKYLDLEKAEGIVYTTLLGKAISYENLTYVWDGVEENPWGHETNSAFVPSKVIVTRRQSYGACASAILPCESDKDCNPQDVPNYIVSSKCGETLEGTKGCIAWQWCPPENSYNSTEYYLEGAAHQQIWLKYQVQFKRLADTEYSNMDATEMTLYPGPNSDAWEVNDITLMAGSNFSDITEKGAVIEANLVVNCLSNPAEDCDTHLEVERLDDIEQGGFSLQYARYYREGETLYRDLIHFRGVRFLFSCSGIYTKASLYKIVLEISAALGLLIAATAITDGVMLNVMKEKRHYRQLKIKEIEVVNED